MENWIIGIVIAVIIGGIIYLKLRNKPGTSGSGGGGNKPPRKLK